MVAFDLHKAIIGLENYKEKLQKNFHSETISILV